RLYGATLFDPVPDPRASELTNDSIRVVGPDLVFGSIYKKIGYYSLNESLLQDLVISRITHPGSKLKLSNYLNDTGRKNISVYSIYRFMDRLNSKLKNEIETISFSYTKQLLGGNIGVVFYDMTTIYFEASEPDDFRIAGFSKEGKHQNPQIMLGLLVGKDGYPVGYELFEGNTFEGHTLIPVLERYLKRFSIEKPIVVADSGLLSKSNIDRLVENQYSFIIGARIKNESDKIIDKIMRLKLKDGQLAVIDKGNGFKLHIGYSEKRAKKDLFNRERGIIKLERNLRSGKLTKANINNRGYNKFLKLDGEISISIDEEKLEKDKRWDGLKGYLTNTTLASKDIVENYNNLWKIEKAFRISKTDLKIRPVYHRLKERIEAHICISFMAYLIYKELERVLSEEGNEISMSIAIENINKMYEIVIDENITIKLKNNKIQKAILKVVTLNF
ncbi:MAG TPA: IS1634 family transposase, partial [Flavobacteriaceae bacterium]|nr:IS1634 family transposase [Flavobacteriaceae bacterium]